MMPLFLKMLTLILAVTGFAFFAAPAYAGTQGDGAVVQGFRVTDLPLPRFVSLRADKVYVRAGPALRYPIQWVYRRAGLPVEITQEFESWRRIRDHVGDEGWVHQSLLSGQRSVLIRGDDLVILREHATDQARMVARLEPDVVAHLDRCNPQWCRIHVSGYRGWVERNFLWGIYAQEDFD